MILKSVEIIAYEPNKHFYGKKPTRDVPRKWVTTRDIKFLTRDAHLTPFFSKIGSKKKFLLDAKNLLGLLWSHSCKKIHAWRI